MNKFTFYIMTEVVSALRRCGNVIARLQRSIFARWTATREFEQWLKIKEGLSEEQRYRCRLAAIAYDEQEFGWPNNELLKEEWIIKLIAQLLRSAGRGEP